MKLLRNREVTASLLALSALLVPATAAAFLWEIRFGLFTLGLGLLFLWFFLEVTARRYRKIAALSEEIDKILHGEALTLSAYREGELAVLQSEIEKMTVRLREQAEKLREDKRFLSDSLADISHQIRTPLTSLNLLVGLLYEPGLKEEKRQEHLRQIASLLSRIDWLITSLLKLSRLDAGTVLFREEKLPLEALIKEAAAPLSIPFELRGQTLTVTAEGNFVGDRAYTVEALGNILKNCAEHTPPGGEITVTAKENPLFAEISVSDTGPGIDPADLPHIFERFYKGKENRETGFGIGLALARKIVVSQNGTVKAENLTPNGAKFTLRFYKGAV